MERSRKGSKTISPTVVGPDTKNLYRKPSAAQIRRAAEVYADNTALAIRRGRVQENVPVAERVNTVDFYGIDLPWPDR